MRLTSLDCSYHPLHHGTSQAQRCTVGEPLDSRGPKVARIDSAGPLVELADGAVYVWTPVGWGRVDLDAMVHLPHIPGDWNPRSRDTATATVTYEETDDAETDIGQRTGGAGDGRDDDGGGAGAAEPGPSSDRGDVGASAESGPGPLPSGASRPQARRRAR